MQYFTYDLPRDQAAALQAGATQDAMYIAGGTDLMQLMKDNIVAPTRLVDLAPLGLNTITADAAGLHLGALARMSDVAAHPDVVAHYSAISQALLAAASPQLRNMGTMGGNLLQRTRCGYFRDTGSACNKRSPGSGCPAIAGQNRLLAILGASDQCIATHPSDLPVALAAMDAELAIQSPSGPRTVQLADLYKLPGQTPAHETMLAPGDLITELHVPAPAPRSSYLKVRDRAAFEFAVVSVAVVLDLDGTTIRRARLAAGGVAPRPWRLTAVEQALQGQPATEASFRQAAVHAADGAVPHSQNGFKIPLLRNAVVRALQRLMTEQPA